MKCSATSDNFTAKLWEVIIQINSHVLWKVPINIIRDIRAGKLSTWMSTIPAMKGKPIKNMQIIYKALRIKAYIHVLTLTATGFWNLERHCQLLVSVNYRDRCPLQWVNRHNKKRASTNLSEKSEKLKEEAEYQQKVRFPRPHLPANLTAETERTQHFCALLWSN